MTLISLPHAFLFFSCAARSSCNKALAGYADGGNVALLAELDSTGKQVGSFGPGGVVLLTGANDWNALAVDESSGYIFTAGYGVNGRQDLAVGEFSLSGRPVNRFGVGGVVLEQIGTDSSAANAMTLNGDKILLAGYEQSKYLDQDGQMQNSWPLVLMQFNEDGALDQSFGAGGVLVPPTAGLQMMDHKAGMGVAVSGDTIAVVGELNDNTIFVANYQMDSTSTIYNYDVRNKMVGFSDGTNTASYVYDDAGNRVAETVTSGGTSTTSFYLTDEDNPTGYAQPLEVWTSSDDNRLDATLQATYILGDRILAQVDSSGNVSYLLTDGHGSTQQMTDASGNVTATFSYDAFGTALNFDASSAPTVFLFGGDAVYDPTSGLYMHGNGVRDRLGFEFIQRDTTNGKITDSLSLHKYLYADANPENMSDPSGHFGIFDYVNSVISEVEGQDAITAQLAIATGMGASNSVITGLITGAAMFAVAPLTRLGGYDITNQLTAIGDFFIRNPQMVPHMPMGYVNWDMEPLAAWGIPANNGFTSLVTVNGQVYYPADVNYFLWGLWGYASGRSLPFLRTELIIHRVQANFGPTGSGYGRMLWTEAGYSYAKTGVLSAPNCALSGYIPGPHYGGNLTFSIDGGGLNGAATSNGSITDLHKK